MKRRRFLSLGAGVGVASVADALIGSAQTPVAKPITAPRKPVLVRANESRRADGTNGPHPYQHTLLRSADSDGRLVVMTLPPGDYAGFAYQGSPLHVHHENDEWLYILEGVFVAEVGGSRYKLQAGDSLLLPMHTPHRWSPAAGTRFGALHQYTPAGSMDIFFDDPITRSKARPTQKEMEAEFARCGMTLLGPPLTKDEIDAV